MEQTESDSSFVWELSILVVSEEHEQQIVCSPSFFFEFPRFESEDDVQDVLFDEGCWFMHKVVQVSEDRTEALLFPTSGQVEVKLTFREQEKQVLCSEFTRGLYRLDPDQSLDGFYHVDRQMSKGETDFTVLWIKQNILQGVRHFVPAEVLPPSFVQMMEKFIRKGRKIKFAPKKGMLDITFFDNRKPPALLLGSSEGSIDPSTFLVQDLKMELSKRNLSPNGKKSELIRRLRNFVPSDSRNVTMSGSTLNDFEESVRVKDEVETDETPKGKQRKMVTSNKTKVNSISQPVQKQVTPPRNVQLKSVLKGTTRSDYRIKQYNPDDKRYAKLVELNTRRNITEPPKLVYSVFPSASLSYTYFQLITCSSLDQPY
eukprot:TRINITY_DN2595_c1_g1_i11.p1 TRINITY_DN2595_c1_g1~~TRINITY_DN2595_c1_g1_i11.p1  ORF type:complete len:372 (-),score=59.37 TRINITY_DN2595_c1_g1_i11:1477-2592(-)